MSRYIPPVTQRAWRFALGSLAIVASATVITALLISAASRAIDAALVPLPLDGQWLIRAGRAETDQVVLNPAADAIGTALYPIAAPAFTLQARIDLQDSAGSGGLIVQAEDADHFTAFLISGDGYFRVSDYRNGAWIDRVAWRAWPHIRRAGGNVLRAECGSNRCTFFVNDEWTWEEPRVPVTPWLGVMSDGAEARFDQLGWQP
jgi:hypothetical protein